MSYIGNLPTNVAFVTDQFNGDGSTVAFTMSVAPATTSSILVAVTGVLQDPSTYSVAGTTLTFSAAPPSGTGNISVRYLGIPASGVTTTAYRTVTEFTATAGQTTFSVPSYTVGYIDVYRNGSRLGTADYTATNGTTVVLAAACNAGDLVVTESFYVSSVLNAIPATAGAVNSTYIAAGAVGSTQIAAGAVGASALALGAANMSYFYASRSGTQLISTGTATKAQLNNVLQSGSSFDATTNYRFTATASDVGKWLFYGQVSFYDNGNTMSAAFPLLYFNGAINVGNYGYSLSGSTGANIRHQTQSFMAVVSIAQNDYVELYGQASSTSGQLYFFGGDSAGGSAQTTLIGVKIA